MSKICIFVIESLPAMRYAQAAHTGGSLAIFEILPAARKRPTGSLQLSKLCNKLQSALQFANALPRTDPKPVQAGL